MIKLELSTENDGGFSDAQILVCALMNYSQGLFEYWDELADKQKKSEFPRALKEAEILLNTYGELSYKLAEELIKKS